MEEIRIGHLHIIIDENLGPRSPLFLGNSEVLRRMKMKADAIRDQNEPVRKRLRLAQDENGSGEEIVGYMTVLVLGEIAAQLAELNENLGRVICQPPTYSGKLSAVRVQQY